MSSKTKTRVCCLASLQEFKFEIAIKLLKYFHNEQVELETAVKQIKLIADIENEMMDRAINYLKLIPKFSPTQIYSELSDSDCETNLDKLAKMKVPETLMVPAANVKPITFKMSETISNSSIHGALENLETDFEPSLSSPSSSSALFSLNEIVQNLNSNTLSNRPYEHYQYKLLDSILPPLSGGESLSSLPSPYQPRIHSISKMGKNFKTPNNFVIPSTQIKDVNKNVINQNKVKNSEVRVMYINVDKNTEINFQNKTNEKSDTRINEKVAMRLKKIEQNPNKTRILVLEPPIKWKDITLLNANNHFPPYCVLNEYGNYFISQIRLLLHGFYLDVEIAPSIKDIEDAIMETCKFKECHKFLLAKIITECCSFFPHCTKSGIVYFERRLITEWRVKYLHTIANCRKRRLQIFYVWIKLAYVKSNLWADIIENLVTGHIYKKKGVSSTSLTALVQVASEEDGMLPEFYTTFICNSDGNIPNNEFTKWFDNFLAFINCKNKSVAVVIGDYVPFYTKFGGYDSTTEKINDYIQLGWCPERRAGDESKSILNYNKFTHQYKVYQDMQKQYEKKIKILYLPPLHAELNPIEYHFQKVKEKYLSLSKVVTSHNTINKYALFETMYEIADKENFHKKYLKKSKDNENIYFKSSILLLKGVIQENSLNREQIMKRRNFGKKRSETSVHNQVITENSNNNDKKKIASLTDNDINNVEEILVKDISNINKSATNVPNIKNLTINKNLEINSTIQIKSETFEPEKLSTSFILAKSGLREAETEQPTGDVFYIKTEKLDYGENEYSEKISKPGPISSIKNESLILHENDMDVHNSEPPVKVFKIEIN